VIKMLAEVIILLGLSFGSLIIMATLTSWLEEKHRHELAILKQDC